MSKMKPEIKILWVGALLSDEYKQNQGQLCKIEADGRYYCCLGVLTDIYQKHNPEARLIESEEFGTVTYVLLDQDGIPVQVESAVLPQVVADWAGLNDVTPVFENKHYEHLPSHPSLAEANDTGLSFTEMAKVIKEQF